VIFFWIVIFEYFDILWVMERPRVGVGAIILNPDKKIFLSQRGPEANNERGKWEGPGGSVGLGEKL
jgi:8-oxo-dGTP pyrophosphatase MutT (NUDIX family)